ncbi:tetratricopeptide repeat protein [Gilvimarinus polysaccharolyticus]|uniref:tetratricopeptide repeat protein n=1 Tax=Gilvimarinus polysaccharolyticus TaxID=863921 RepID=UPI0006730C3C|nr:tetratricopeptide repeat protein [Gilvimarinus polysaccharolyticus]
MYRGIIVALIFLLSACSTQQYSAEDVFANQERAERFYQQSNYQPALTEYRKVIEALPLHIHSWLRVGNCLAQLGRYPEAVAAYERALRIDPQFTSAWINLSYVQAQILTQTVASMHEQVPKTDPQIERVQVLVNSVLTPFGLAQQKANNSTPELPDDGAIDVMNADEPQ